MEPFVKREDPDCKRAEEISLVRKIELRTENLLKDLNSVENLTNSLNKMLLPPKSTAESEANKVEESPPRGWFENHLERLDFACYRSGQIYDQVTRLMRATRIDVK